LGGQVRAGAEGVERKAESMKIPPRISLISRMKNDGFPIREIREIRGKKSSRK
jgi:hypothetical protein